MIKGAGTKPKALELTAGNIYSHILKANAVLDDADVPETGRYLVVTPATYLLMKESPEITMNSDIGQELRLHGAVGTLDGFNGDLVEGRIVYDAFVLDNKKKAIYYQAHTGASVFPS